MCAWLSPGTGHLQGPDQLCVCVCVGQREFILRCLFPPFLPELGDVGQSWLLMFVTHTHTGLCPFIILTSKGCVTCFWHCRQEGTPAFGREEGVIKGLQTAPGKENEE